MSRMRVLNSVEQETFDTPPLFDHRQRRQLLDIPGHLLKTCSAMRSSNAASGFVLLAMYFKATKRFYLPIDFHQRDIDAVAKKLGSAELDFDPSQYRETTRLRHQKLILDFYGFEAFSTKATAKLEIEIATMARQYLKPRLIFWRCVDFLTQSKTQLPRSTTLIDLVRSGLQNHKNDLVQQIDDHLSGDARTLLDELFTMADDTNRYRLTLLKRLSQSTRPKKVKESIADFEIISDLYHQLETTLKALNFGHAGIRYYAGSVQRSKVSKISRRTEADRYVHTAAFVAHQFYRSQDNLVDMLLSAVASFQTKVSRQHKDLLFEQRIEQTNAMQAMVHNLDVQTASLQNDIRSLLDHTELNDAQKLVAIKERLEKQDLSAIEAAKTTLERQDPSRSRYQILEKNSLALQNQVAPILKVLTFEVEGSANSLLEALDHFKARNGHLTASAPMSFMTAEECAAVHPPSGKFKPSLHKVMLFLHCVSAIKSGTFNLRHSYKYQPLEAYLISKKRWQADKAELLERAGLTQYADPKVVLANLKQKLYAQYQATNDGADGNPHLRVRSDGHFTIKTPAANEDEENPLDHLFPQRHVVPLAQILDVINSHTGMLDAFEHWQQTSSTQSAPKTTLIAGIMSLGCAIGVGRMANTTSQVTQSQLENIVNWHFSLENVRAANDLVLKAMDDMELPNIYRRQADKLHTASDGQKFEVRGEALHASRSFKYFGQSQGVSAYSFIEERNLLWHSIIISAADRESAYVIDGLMRNDVVKSDIHSTDTHGYNEVIFGLTHLLGFTFAPRIKNIAKQVKYLFYGHEAKERKDWQIKHDKYVNEKLICENWDDLLRLVVTIKLKENTASDIFRRLNSYSRQHKLYQTAKAFGQIIKSQFILKYLDDLDLRQAIEKQLNRIELSNAFTRAVAVGSPRELLASDKESQEIAEACNRLIKNSIVCWNYLYLTRKLERTKDPEAKAELLEAIASISTNSWGHINMLGEYDLSEEKLLDAFDILPLKPRPGLSP